MLRNNGKQPRHRIISRKKRDAFEGVKLSEVVVLKKRLISVRLVWYGSTQNFLTVELNHFEQPFGEILYKKL